MLLFSLGPFTKVAQEMFLQMRRHARYIKSQLQRTDSLAANVFLCFLRNLSFYMKLSDKANHLFVDAKKPDKLHIKQSFTLFIHCNHVFCIIFQVPKSLKCYNVCF